MCSWNNTAPLHVKAHKNWVRHISDGRKLIEVDSCLADIIYALNEAGIHTEACCCGHGKRPGNIILSDGRELVIAKNYEEGRAVDKAFPPIN